MHPPAENERFPSYYSPPAEVVTSDTLNDLSNRFDVAILAEGLNYSTIAPPPSTEALRRSFHSSL